MFYFFKGILIGLSIAAPVGPIGLLCIRRSLAHGKLSGLLSGLGAATADGFYGFIAAFGLSFISSFLLKEKMVLSIIGGLFLCYLGIKTFKTKPADRAAKAIDRGLVSDYLSTLFLTVTNPVTILSFLAIFAGVGIEPGKYSSATILVVGVFLGSALWWILLSSIVGLLKGKMSVKVMDIINKVSGSIIFFFGIAALASVVK